MVGETPAANDRLALGQDLPPAAASSPAPQASATPQQQPAPGSTSSPLDILATAAVSPLRMSVLGVEIDMAAGLGTGLATSLQRKCCRNSRGPRSSRRCSGTGCKTNRPSSWLCRRRAENGDAGIKYTAFGPGCAYRLSIDGDSIRQQTGAFDCCSCRRSTDSTQSNFLFRINGRTAIRAFCCKTEHDGRPTHSDS